MIIITSVKLLGGFHCPDSRRLHPKVGSGVSMMDVSLQILWLFVLSIPIACIAWTVTHEEVFREPREYCLGQCERPGSILRRKFFYLFTCEYCFSHYAAAFFLILTRYKLFFSDWRGYLIALFALVWIANQYMSIYNRLRLDIKHERVEIVVDEEELKKEEKTARPQAA
jgi:hypothetical protein